MGCASASRTSGRTSRKAETRECLSWSLTEHRCALDCFQKVSLDVNSRDPSRKLNFNPLHGDYSKTDGLHFHKRMFNCPVSEDWPRAIVTPVAKGPRTTDPRQFRPISLTSVVYKILQTILKEKLLPTFATDNKAAWLPPPPFNRP